MFQFLLNVFGSSTWEPHGHCFAWSQPLLGIMVIANLLIGLAYFSIPFALIQLVRRRSDLTHRPVFILFAVFILGCGAGHFVKLWTIYEPVYRLQGWVDAATAAASVGTAVLLWPLLPAILRLPSPSQLQSVNEELGREVQARRQAENDLQQMAEAALRDSQMRLAGIIDSAMDAIISINEQQQIILFNHAAEEIFRISAQAAMGRHISEFIPPRYREAHKQHIATFRETGKTHRSMKDPPTVPAMRADGTEFPIEATISQTVVSGERIYTVILRDVTPQVEAQEDRKRMLESLQREQTRLKAIIEQVPSGLTIREASGELVMYSAATPEMLGHDLALSTDYSDYRSYGAVHQDGTRYASDEYPVTRALRGDKVVQEEMIYQRGDGSLTVLSVNASPLLDAGGAIIGAISTFTDISEQKRAETTQSLLASIVENTEDSIVGKDLNGMIISWNKGAERIYGYSSDEAIGKPIQLIFPPDRANEEAVILERIRNGGSITDFETERKRADGSIIHVSLTVSPVRDVTGRIVGASAITRDITTRVEQALRHQELLRLEQQARIAAEEASALKSEFLGMVSHELRTPLTSIMGFASTLLAEDVSFAPDVQRDFINIINLESGKLKDLVEQLLDVTRIQAKSLRIQPRPQPLANAVEVAGSQLETLLQTHQLEFDIPDNLPLVDADEKRIGQVIVNLVDNAVKFSPEGTHIKVSAAANGDDEVRIAVTDEGIGIPETHHAWVFEPFRQVGEQFTSRGAGLGLAICKGLVEAHGGRIWIENGRTQGTTVVFTLPVAR